MSDKLPFDYPRILDRIKSEIRSAQLKATIAVNSALLEIYWQIGIWILDRQRQSRWGAKIIDQLSADLRHEFPDMQGLSSRNLKYMRQFAFAYPDAEFGQRPLAQISWYHHITLLNKVKDHQE